MPGPGVGPGGPPPCRFRGSQTRGRPPQGPKGAPRSPETGFRKRGQKCRSAQSGGRGGGRAGEMLGSYEISERAPSGGTGGRDGRPGAWKCGLTLVRDFAPFSGDPGKVPEGPCAAAEGGGPRYICEGEFERSFAVKLQWCLSPTIFRDSFAAAWSHSSGRVCGEQPPSVFGGPEPLVGTSLAPLQRV